MHKRTYNKLFVNTNREEGSEKIFLGYQNDTTEYLLRKDNETYFNIPPYTTPISLADSTLIIDGATGGLFPAVSDRIFESRKNYGNVSNHGTPSEIPDGTWFCSWLYENPTSGSLQWMDRYFNPKQLNFNVVESETFNGFNYVLNAPAVFQASENTVIYDTPSTMFFEPGVLYKYFHLGEKAAQDILLSFGGISGDRLLLNITDWKASQTGTYPVTITSSTSSDSLFPNPKGSQVILSSALGFEHNNNVDAFINWNKNYIPSHDFTLGFWCKSSQWSTCPSTQLFGNFSARGGFGVFVDTLKTYPYFVIPETTYGHLLLINQESQGFLDKVVVSELSALDLRIPSIASIDSEDCVVVCSLSSTTSEDPILYKLDHVGNLLAKTTVDISLSAGEFPVSLLIDAKDNVILTTNQTIYTYDSVLTLSAQQTQILTLPSNKAASAFTYDIANGTYELVTVPNAIDVKYIQDTEWAIFVDGILYKDKVPFLSADNGFTNLQIDPNGRIWTLHGNNNVSVYDPNGLAFQNPLFSFTVGADYPHEKKHLSFINTYNRSKLTNEWVSVIYYEDSHYIYTNTLEGRVSNIVDINPFIDYKVTRRLQQNTDAFKYGSDGDFTGYERKRVFNALTSYNQIVIKAALRDKLTSQYTYKVFKSGIAINDWDPETWKHVILTHKNRTLTLYFNGIKQTSFDYSGRYELSFEQQPALYIGSPLGVSNGLNKEISSLTSLFNGMIGDIKFYNYCISETNFDMFLRSGIAAQDMIWSLPIPTISYIETIERMFKNKIPGSKSNFYNIKLTGTNIKDPTTRALIEEQIKKIVAEISPIHADLVKVVWIG